MVENKFLFTSSILLIFWKIIQGISLYSQSNKNYIEWFLITSLLFALTISIYFYIGMTVVKLIIQNENRKEMGFLTRQIKEAENQIQMLRSNQEKTLVYRHDLRHHLAVVDNLIQNNKRDQLTKYLEELHIDIEAITPIRICANELLNLVLTLFLKKAEALNIALTFNIQLKHKIELKDTELCGLISNGLENAINAVGEIQKEESRKILLEIKTRNNNLLIQIENPFLGTVVLENNFPKSKDINHGFGTKSIKVVVEKYNGHTLCLIENNIFTLQVILPLTKLRFVKS